MAATVGIDTSYDLTVGVKLNVEDMIWLISPFDVPLQGTNGADGRTTLSTDTCFEVKVEWLDEMLLTPRTTLANTAATADTYVTVASGTSRYFQTGDTFLIDSEYMYVTGYGTTTDTLTVTRAWDGVSVAAQHAGPTPGPAATLVGVGAAIAEGSDAQAARAQDRVDRFNLTQIFGPYTVQVSGTENAVQKYGLTGTEFDHQVANRVKELSIGVEQALIYGTLVNSTGTKQRTMGGFRNYITTNVDTTSTQLTDTTILAQLENCFDQGGVPDRFMVGSYQKRNVSAINSTNIRYAQMTNARGQVVDYYDSDYGQISVVLNRWCRRTDGFIFCRDQATVVTLRPMQFEMLAKTGDSERGQVLGEKSLIFRRQQWASQFQALT
jgi:Family of unknown function (DUF5309)